MGFANIGPGSLLLILVIVMLLFGTKKLRSIGQDLAGAIKSFREGIDETKTDEHNEDEDKRT